MRTDRFFAVNSAWYFTTREGGSVGPYDSKSAAKSALEDFICFIKKADKILADSFLSTIKT